VTTILLARHGETDWNRDGRFQGHADPPLNDRGREQARRLAETLDGEPLDALYASDLRRAAETAAIVGAKLGLEVSLEASLREIDVGSWLGRTREEIGDEPWDGETYDHHRERVLQALRRIEELHPSGRVLVVSHGGSLRRVQEALLGEAMPVIDHCGVWPVVVESGDLRRLH
jgi:broad specificity phosphatase PhoE